MTTLNGHLELFWETGSEHVRFSFHEDGKEGYAGLHELKKGDVVRVFNDASRATIAWEGTIDFEYDSHKQERPVIGNVQWLDGVGHVRGIQKDVDAEQWGALFAAEKPAQLTLK